jgi:hypothetical protein
MNRMTVAVLILAGGLVAGRTLAGVSTREETVGDRKQMVMENELVRLVVLPDPGGTVVEFVNKRTGVNFVYGGEDVRKGQFGRGWKDFYVMEALDQLGKGVFSLPYKGEFREGKGYKAIFVSCDAEDRRFERELRLTDNGAELTTLIKITNIGKEPRRLQCRWHTYSQLDDPLASNSCIIAPGPGGEARKCFIGSGYDHQYITSDGYWMAVNTKSGQGLWMTFKKEQSGMHLTWTDYNVARKGPSRGAFLAEPYPQPILAQPGQSVTYESTFYPFTAEDKPETIPLGVLSDPAEQERARQFLAMVRPNLAAIGPYTMTPGEPPAGLNAKPDENRFDFSHRRRDRFALRPWGILDAMMAVPNVQDQSIRCRYYARIFDSVQKPRKVSFRLQMLDAFGMVAREQTKDYTIDPVHGRELDVRDDVAMTGLADGWYTFVLQGIVEGEKEPVHTYTDTRRLVGQARPAYDKRVADKTNAPPVERPFVTALRKVDLPASQKGNVTVPIGVEEGGGLARKGWPVRGGVPFAQGLLAKGSAFDLVGPDGKAVVVQVEPMATWMDGSLKWLLVDFPADVPANGHVFFTLKGKPGTMAGPAPLAVQKGDEISVGAARYSTRDGKLFGLFGPEDLWWDDGAGQKYYFRLKGEGAGVVVEENGVNRAVVKATGWYVNDKDRPVCMGELRLETYRGQSFTKLYHTVMFAGDPWKETLGSYGLRFQLPRAGYEAASMELDGKPVTGKQIALLQRSSDGAELTVDGQASRGARSIGAVVFSGGTNVPLGFYHRDFWQMAPKKLVADATAGTVTVSYWPAESGAMSFLPREDGWIPCSSTAEAIAVGMSRTHEIVIDSGAPGAVVDYEKVFSEPVVTIVPPKYLAATKAMLHLAPYCPERQPILEWQISNTIDFFISQRELFGWYGEWVYGAISGFWRSAEFRWWDYGRYKWILNEEDIVEAPWLCFMRSGDRKYLKFAESNTRHLLEVGTIRWNPAWPQYVGFSRRHHECLWLGGGDTGHSMLDPFLDYYYVTGYKPARDAAERLAGGMAKVTSGEWRYISNPIAGLSRLYLDTQNPFYKEQADRLWKTLCYPEQNTWWVIDHGDRMVLWYSQLNPQCKELWKAWTLDPEKKDRFTGVDVLTALYLETGEARYGAAAARGLPRKAAMALGSTQAELAAVRAWCYADPTLSMTNPPILGK